MTAYTKRILISATPQRVWHFLEDVERWPSWTRAMRGVQRLGPEPLGLNSRVRIDQPPLRPGVWTICEWQPPERFAWMTSVPGVTIRATHLVQRVEVGSAVTLEVRMQGVLARLAGWLVGERTARCLELEAQGLKRRSEHAEPVEA